MTKLTTEALDEIAKEALTRDGESIDHAIKVEGLVQNYAFNPERIKAAKPRIDAFLNELPDNFQKDKGGGWSFLKAAEDRHGNLWGQHRDIELLVVLGIAAGSASWLGKEMMKYMPGGVPYFEVHPEPATQQHPV